MRVEIDNSRCMSNGLCEASVPSIFRVVEDDGAEVLQQPSDELKSRVEDAARLCPTQAISIIDV